MDSPKAQYTTNMIPSNKRDRILEGVNSLKNGGVWSLKNDISSPKSYELFINKALKGDTAVDLKRLHSHFKMCINTVTRLQEYPLTDYQSIKRHAEFG